MNYPKVAVAKSPLIPHPLLKRTRLLESLDPERTVQAIWGPPGSGKTLLLHGFQQQRSEICTRLGLGTEHANLPALQRAIHSRLSEQGAHPHLAAGHTYHLLLDDFHWIAEKPELISWLENLIKRYDGNLRMVVAGCYRPTNLWTALENRGIRYELNEPDLRLTEEEALQLVRDIHHFKISASRVKQIRTQTRGWVLPFCLAARGLGQRDGSLEPLKQFFLSEVFLIWDEPVRRFLQTTAVVARFCEDLASYLCSDFLTREDVLQIILKLKAAGFVNVPARTGYNYAPAFREFLVGLSGDQAQFYSLKATRWLEENGQLLKSAAAREEARGHWPESRQLFLKALTNAKKTNDPTRHTEFSAGLLSGSLHWSEPAELHSTLAEMLEESSSQEAHRIYMSSWRGSLHVLEGDNWARGYELLRQAYNEALETGLAWLTAWTGSNLAFGYHLPRGEYSRACALLKKGERLCRGARLASLHVRHFLHRSKVYLLCGQPDKAAKLAQRTLQRRKMDRFNRLGFRCIVALAQAVQGRSEAAQQTLFKMDGPYLPPQLKPWFHCAALLCSEQSRDARDSDVVHLERELAPFAQGFYGLECGLILAQHLIRTNRIDEARKKLNALRQISLEAQAIHRQNRVDEMLKQLNTPTFAIRCFGQLRWEHEGTSVLVESKLGRGARELFKWLICSGKRVVPTEQILDQFYPGTDSKTARNRLSVNLAAVRGLTPEKDLVTKVGDGYRLNFDKYSCDLVRFEELLQRAGRQNHTDPQAARALLQEALKIRQEGQFLETEFYDDRVKKRRKQLEIQLAELTLTLHPPHRQSRSAVHQRPSNALN